jgi:hypothetical protein
VKKNKKYYIRKIHRILGVSIGIQFLFWTVSGIYFSWTDIDDIHGDQFLSVTPRAMVSGLKSISEIVGAEPINSLELRFIVDQPYYWINNQELYNAKTGVLKNEITKSEAIDIVKGRVKEQYVISNAELITETGKHHEYRERPLPAWMIEFKNPKDLIAYVSAKDGSFQRIRHQEWRWFDFLWMFHTMDYEGRDDFNNILLRAFSLFGFLTVLSGFILYFLSSKTLRKLFPAIRKIN